jgi:hypothetical protein
LIKAGNFQKIICEELSEKKDQKEGKIKLKHFKKRKMKSKKNIKIWKLIPKNKIKIIIEN